MGKLASGGLEIGKRLTMRLGKTKGPSKKLDAECIMEEGERGGKKGRMVGRAGCSLILDSRGEKRRKLASSAPGTFEKSNRP